MALLWATGSAAADRISISAELDTTCRTIAGWVTVTWPSLNRPFSDVEFRLYANMRTNKFGPAGPGQLSDSTYTLVDTLLCGEVDVTNKSRAEGTDLYCPTDRTYAMGEALTVRLHFTTHVGTLSRGVDRLFQAGGEYLLDGWFPMPAPHRDGQWINVKYEGLTELVADFFDFDVRLTVPESLRAIGAGLTAADTTGGKVTYSYSLPEAHDFALYLSPAMEMKRYPHGSTAISIYTSRHNAYLADAIADVCGKTLDHIGGWVAPYPFPELQVVVCEIGFVGGIELPRMIILSEPPAGQFLGFKDVVAIHEVAHQWFYGIIASDQARTPWMDEAVSDYFTERVARTLYGENNFLDWWGITLDYSGLQRLQGLPAFDRLPITMPAEQYYSMSQYAATVYNKGAVTLRTLFNQLKPGDEESFWHRYYELYHFATPGESDFLRLISEYEPFVGNDIASRVLHNSQAVDYVIERIANEPFPTMAGSADSVPEAGKSGRRYRITVEYAMYHPIDLPVTLRLSFADGKIRDTTLAPVSGQGKLALEEDEPIISATLDPEWRIGLDKDLLNNSLSLNGNGSGLRLFSGITFLVESLFSYLWGM
ncbi:hypothetical protein C3F09_01440 [candidate division GN15 bacterium]|uniref:Peptidase M1 membrane alanine aminopeptidase domain-containing protein n=1 Tax=candidate division GN15 bacterium TaxID=2072418 RepID=A0A855XB48_9BACT|nr:MAG: hypothetical protein C3F09_01440 [candidate division GN15 bacterium]